MPEKPWIILTLRRTGGTELTTALARLSSFPTIEHEPFNPERKLGHVTQAYQRHADPDQLRAQIDSALEKTPNIKHCVEVLPIAITRALIDAAQARNYHVILLTRRNEARRIASLLLAQATGAWGAQAAADIYPRIIAGAQAAQPIDLERVSQRVSADFAALGQTLTLLRNRRIAWDWQVFEEIYLGDRPVTDALVQIAQGAGVQVTTQDPRLQGFATGKGQNSAMIGAHVPNYPQALARLETLCAA